MSAFDILSGQSSISDFLSSISSRASELAVNTVNHLIEDQLGDPTKLELNICRVKDVLSRCHRVTECGGGDCPAQETTTTLLTIPRKVRQQIWSHLDDISIKTLRCVCQQLKHEMDFDVGLPVILTPDTFRSVWMRSISIRSCIVKKMATIFTLNLFAKPEKLERISFDHHVFIDADMAELIIRKFRNLKQIILYTEDVSELNSLHEEANSNEISSKLVSRLEDQFQLTALDVKFDTTKWKLKWNIKMKPQSNSKLWEVQEVMGPFGISGIAKVIPKTRDESKKLLKTVTLSIPFVQDRDRFAWLRVLSTQNSLTSLTCDLNATHWRDYKVIIRKNRETLQKLFLLNITDGQKSFAGIPGEHHRALFDWKMFDDCNELEDITLIADTFMHSSLTNCSLGKRRRYMASVNLVEMNLPKLRIIWLENFQFSEDEADFLKYEDSTEKKNARFEQCTLKNCRIAEEDVAEAQVGSQKGRDRCLESLSFATINYKEEIDAFERYTTAKLSPKPVDPELLYYDDVDMMEFLRFATQGPVRYEKRSVISFLSQNMNLLGGIAFTVWLAWTH